MSDELSGHRNLRVAETVGFNNILYAEGLLRPLVGGKLGLEIKRLPFNSRTEVDDGRQS